MAELMNREAFRTALEEAIKGKSANKARSAWPGRAAS